MKIKPNETLHIRGLAVGVVVLVCQARVIHEDENGILFTGEGTPKFTHVPVFLKKYGLRKADRNM